MKVFGYELNELDIEEIEKYVKYNKDQILFEDQMLTPNDNELAVRLVSTCLVICNKYNLGPGSPEAEALFEEALGDPKPLDFTESKNVH